jgi:hypothetical protein
VHQTCLPLRDRRTRRTLAEEEAVAAGDVVLEALPEAPAEAYTRRPATMQRTLETAQTAEVEAAEAGVEGVAEEGVVIGTEHSRKARALHNLSPHSSLLLLAS